MSLVNLRGKVSEYFITENNITDKTPYTIETVDPSSLLTPNRIDLVAKWLYIDFKERGLESDYAEKTYRAHIDAFSHGKFSEPGTLEKDNYGKYLLEFDKIIHGIKTDGFNKNMSLVPVGDNNVALDGAHRIAACLYFNKPITIARFKNLSREFNTNFFEKRGLKPNFIDSLVTSYCRLSGDVYGVCVWQKTYAIDKARSAESIVEGSPAIIIAKKQISLNYQGTKNLLLQIYGHHPWTGDYKNGFKGTKRKVDEVYADNSKLTIFIIQADNLRTILDIKNKVRDTYKVGNSSIHITDNQGETIQLAELVLNHNSVHHLNNAKIEKHKPTHERLSAFRAAIIGSGNKLEDFIVDAGSVLSIYGLREANDLDYLSSSFVKNTPITPAKIKMDAHDSELQYYSFSKDEMIFDPEHHFVFDGIKFVSLDRVAEMKRNRNERKDRDDLHLINSVAKSHPNLDLNAAIRGARIKIYRVYAILRKNAVKLLNHIGLKKPLMSVRNALKRILDRA